MEYLFRKIGAFFGDQISEKADRNVNKSTPWQLPVHDRPPFSATSLSATPFMAPFPPFFLFICLIASQIPVPISALLTFLLPFLYLPPSSPPSSHLFSPSLPAARKVPPPLPSPSFSAPFPNDCQTLRSCPLGARASRFNGLTRRGGGGGRGDSPGQNNTVIGGHFFHNCPPPFLLFIFSIPSSHRPNSLHHWLGLTHFCIQLSHINPHALPPSFAYSSWGMMPKLEYPPKFAPSHPIPLAIPPHHRFHPPIFRPPPFFPSNSHTINKSCPLPPPFSPRLPPSNNPSAPARRPQNGSDIYDARTQKIRAIKRQPKSLHNGTP